MPITWDDLNSNFYFQYDKHFAKRFFGKDSEILKKIVREGIDMSEEKMCHDFDSNEIALCMGRKAKEAHTDSCDSNWETCYYGKTMQDKDKEKTPMKKALEQIERLGSGHAWQHYEETTETPDPAPRHIRKGKGGVDIGMHPPLIGEITLYESRIYTVDFVDGRSETRILRVDQRIEWDAEKEDTEKEDTDDATTDND